MIWSVILAGRWNVSGSQLTLYHSVAVRAECPCIQALALGRLGTNQYYFPFGVGCTVHILPSYVLPISPHQFFLNLTFKGFVMTKLKQKMSKMKAEMTLVFLILTIGMTAEI